MDLYPDSALLMIVSILQHPDAHDVEDAQLLPLLELKQQAFLKLKQTDSFYHTGERIREVASRIPDSLVMAKTLISLYGGIDAKYIKNAEKYMPGAISTFTRKDMPYEAAIITALQGMLWSSEGDFVRAQRNFLSAIRVFEKLDSLKALGKVYTNMGNNYAGIGSMEESTLYYTKSYEIAQERNDTLDQVSTLMNIGINYRQNSPDSAMAIYEKALALLYAKNSALAMKIKFNMANLYVDKKDVDKAASIMMEIERGCEETNFMEGVAVVNNGLGGVYFLSKRYPEALERYRKAIVSFDAIGLKESSLRSQTELMDCYEAMGDYKNAFVNTKDLQRKKDSLFATEKQVAVHDLEKKYQTEKKELENTYLKKTASIRNIALFILVAGVIALFLLLKKSNWLYKERGLAYNVLMDRYKEERRLRKLVNEELPPMSENPPRALPDENVNNDMLSHRLRAYFEQEKPYLNPKLKVEDVAASLNCTQKDLSMAFKTEKNMNFNAFTNQFRVREARRLIDDAASDNLKLETIATQSGFGSRQSFYAAFEQFTGVKPGYYRKNILQQIA